MLVTVLYLILALSDLIPRGIIYLSSLIPSPVQRLLDYIYLHSTFLQSIIAYRFADELAPDIISLGQIAGVDVTSHHTLTKDGFSLVMHRLQSQQQCSPKKNDKKCVVLIIHGLMQSSEALLCGGSNSIGATLSNEGYDVFLGNNRGNKYSYKHMTFDRKDEQYWNFSLDDLVKYDVPAMIEYICSYTNSKNIVCIGFSNGSAQLLAALSTNSRLNDAVSLCIALSPAAKAKGFSNKHLSNLLTKDNINRNVFRICGKKAMFSSSVYLWQKLLTTQAFQSIVQKSMKIIFGWSSSNISHSRRVEMFRHIFSDSSVKSVAQWFQIIKRKALSTYAADGSDDSKVYEISNIKTNVAVFAGGSDALIDPYIVEEELKKNNNHISTHIEPSYEHLDLIWADDAHVKIFPKVMKLLEKHT